MQENKNHDLAATFRSMRIGLPGSFYPAPPGMARMEASDWLLRECARLGYTVFQPPALPEDKAELLEYGELAKSLSVELEIFVRGVFGSKEGDKRLFRKNMEQASLLEMPVVRTGYGRLTAETSRYNRNIDREEHLKSLVPALKEAASIAKDAGIRLGVENHCDFTGRELAGLLEMVDSPWVGAALDTGNGFTVYCDPNDDIEVLAPWTFTTHLKDMYVTDYNTPGYIPLIAQGCALGEGFVDLPRALDLLAAQSPCADGLHLIIEPGWLPVVPDGEKEEQVKKFFSDSFQYLQQLVGRKGGASS